MNYVGDHHLNLIGKVAIVTSASSEQGAAICRELLNSNAFVLGVDSVPAHKSTETSRASHFQFFQYDAGKGASGMKVLEYANMVYMKDEVHYFVDVVKDGKAGTEDVRERVVKVMTEQGQGMVVFVGGDAEMVEIQKAAGNVKRARVRCNVVATSGQATKLQKASVLDPEAKNALGDHMQAHSSKRDKGGYAIEPERDVANLVLFLCSKHGEDIDRALMRIDGTCVPIESSRRM